MSEDHLMAQHISLPLLGSEESAVTHLTIPSQCYRPNIIDSQEKKFKSFVTSSKVSKMSMLGWCIVQTTVLPISTRFLTVLITIAAARASSPEVGSSIKMMEGLASSSTAMVSLFRCSLERSFTPGSPTCAPCNDVSSKSSIKYSTNIYNQKLR